MLGLGWMGECANELAYLAIRFARGLIEVSGQQNVQTVPGSQRQS